MLDVQDATQFNLHFIPLFPLLGAIFNLLLGRWVMKTFGDRLGRELVHLVAIAMVAFSCFYTFSAVYDHLVVLDAPRLEQTVYPWIFSGDTQIGLSFLLDRLSGVMCLVVTGVGLLIHIFSVGYMAKDPDYHRYFAYLNLFTAAMLILVLGKSLLVVFVGWEGVGVCSYLLIGFWFTDEAKASAGRKAFIMNRIGDFGFIIGMLLIYAVTNSLDFDTIAAACAGGEKSPLVTYAVLGLPVATVATLALFVGCSGKSAQIPLYTWLPDAMAGPTPVSALIHAATMVTAGVYLIVRLNFLFALAPLTMAIIATIGAATAIFAATIGITQNDIKKVLAYSTVSQLGYMFLAVGMGAWVAAIFHLVTHAFFKACLFLGSGSVIEACHHNQDIRTMGGLREKMPWTSLTFLVSCLAIAGIPIFSGFFSKDEILLHAYVNASAWSPGINYVVYGLGVVAAFCTAFYMFRLYYLTFEGKFRGDHHTWKHHVGEVWIMSFPLVVLGLLATVGGFMGVPHVLGAPLGDMPHYLHDWLEPVFKLSSNFQGDYFIGLREGVPQHDGHVDGGFELGMMAVSVAVAVGGILFARSIYKDGPSAQAQQWKDRLGLLFSASYHKYWIDELYNTLIVIPLRSIAHILYQAVDQLIVDGLGVGGVSGTVSVVGNQVRRWHNGNVRRYLVIMLLGFAGVLAAIYANPTISRVGPSEVNPRFDMGGLRPTMGEQKVHIDVYGVGRVMTVGPEKPPPREAPPEPDEAAPPLRAPAPPPAPAPGGEG